jgi:hypothetical protein
MCHRFLLVLDAERDLITTVLAEMPDGQIAVQAFADKVHAYLLPLKGTTLGEGVCPAGGLRYEYVSLDEDVGGDVSNYMALI